MRLTLFLTHSLSLRTWYEQGTLDRELVIYRKLQDMGVHISIVSYGGRDELEFCSQVPDIRILCNWIGWSDKRYTHRLHQLHGLRLWGSDVFKTNQMIGADVAVRASKLWKKPLVVRMGYLWSYNANQAHPDKPRYLRRVDKIETLALEHAKQVIVTTEDIRGQILESMPHIGDKIQIIPNYVDTEVFRPIDGEKLYDLVYVGRIAKEKNLDALLGAVDRAGASILMIGEGDLSDELQAKWGDLDGRIQWKGKVSNTKLPEYINQAKVYVLSSFYEGHPKALIEAMACRMPIIGTRIRGIQQVIEHEVNGYLCETDEASLTEAIQTVLAQPELMDTMSKNAYDFAVEHYSLDRIAQKEFAMLRRVVTQS